MPNYLDGIFESQYSSTHQFDEFLDFFTLALINSIVNL
jgi:hypothetical protein